MARGCDWGTGEGVRGGAGRQQGEPVEHLLVVIAKCTRLNLTDHVHRVVICLQDFFFINSFFLFLGHGL